MLNVKLLKKEIIGENYFFEGPYGRRLITYADYTASGKTLKFIEKYLIEIQKSYANTHTEDDFTGSYMTRLLHEALDSIKISLNANDNYIIPVGSGATGAINKLSQILGVYIPPFTKENVSYEIKGSNPVVFVSPYEHHSNELIWRESISDVVKIELTEDGFLDLDDLKKKVGDIKYRDRLKIGSFSAASNVTGVKTDVYEVAKILHENNALACFDFAASGPYVEINMNKDKVSYFDAVYISPHKFIGGPGSSGILAINKKIYNNHIAPTCAGGGTVDYVSDFGYDFVKNVESREMAGTPAILQIIKTALAFKIKDRISTDTIEKIEEDFTRKAFKRLLSNKNIKILGPTVPEKRIGIFSFMIKFKDSYLHPRFVTRLLNDLFGIQSRAGCACAGPYGHKLLNIGKEKSEKYRKLINEEINSLKPGWVRVNFHYTINEHEFHFLLNCIEFIANYGYLFLSEYKLDYNTGAWNHINHKEVPLEFNIENVIKFTDKDIFYNKSINLQREYKKYLSKALKLANTLKEKTVKVKKEDWFYYGAVEDGNTLKKISIWK